MNKTLIAIAAIALIALPAASGAAPPFPGPYVSGFFGASVRPNQDVTTSTYGPGATTYNDTLEFDPGINVGGSGGFDFGFLRLEGEVSYKSGEISKITERTRGTSYTNVDGRLGAMALMFNLFFDLRNPSPVTPYIGGGVGFATLYLDDTYGTSTATGQRSRLYRSDDATVFAYQAGAGLEISLTQRFSLDVGYRYFATAKAKFEDQPSGTTEMKLVNHTASVGFRVKF